MKPLAFVVLLLVALLSACASATAPAIEVTEPWVRTVPAADGMGLNGALFMIITNRGADADRLLRVETQAAHMAQVHLSEVDANGVSSMHEVDGIDVPPGGSVELKSGSYHVMLMGLGEGVTEGSTASFTLFFQNAGAVMIEAPVRAP